MSDQARVVGVHKRVAMILIGDAIEKLRELPPGSVQCVVTSPPCWGLRDYGTAYWQGGDEDCDHRPGSVPREQGFEDECVRCGAVRKDHQLGMEKLHDCLAWASPSIRLGAKMTLCSACYICRMVAVFREIWRVLRDDGTVWLNMGDSYSSEGKRGPWDVGRSRNAPKQTTPGFHYSQEANRQAQPGVKFKDLFGIPWRLALALQADGWWLRSDIIWSKPRPMPESVTDRPTAAHEYVFFARQKRAVFLRCRGGERICDLCRSNNKV